MSIDWKRLAKDVDLAARGRYGEGRVKEIGIAKSTFYRFVRNKHPLSSDVFEKIVKFLGKTMEDYRINEHE